MVTDCPELVVFNVWLLKVMDVGANPNVTSVPVPVRLTVCGLPVPLEVMVKVPVRVPVAEGVKPMFTVQVNPEESEVEQVFELMEKSPELTWKPIPVTLPLFAVKVTPCVGAAFETATLLKLSDDALKPKPGASPLPLRLILF